MPTVGALDWLYVVLISAVVSLVVNAAVVAFLVRKVKRNFASLFQASPFVMPPVTSRNLEGVQPTDPVA